MTDDLATRLRALLDRVPDSDAVIIDKTDMLALLDALTVRDAVIAEALAALAVPAATVLTEDSWHGRAAKARAILSASRVPQGAADPTEIDGLHEQYPEVARFVTRMLRELWANRGKGDQAGWRAMSLRQAWSEIAWHVGKMTTAIKTEDWALVRELAADVANGAMMLDDIVQLSAEYRKAMGSR